jgi:hypothetical protein
MKKLILIFLFLLIPMMGWNYKSLEDISTAPREAGDVENLPPQLTQGEGR